MDLNHVAVFVDNIEESALAPALGGWGAPTTTISGQPVIVDGRPGEHSGRTRRIRTASEPPLGVSVEDVAADAPIQPVPGNAWHHVAVWCADIYGTLEVLERQGYRKDVVGRGPDGELATFAYMVSDNGPRVELADAAMKERMLEYFAQAAANGSTVAEGGLAAPLAPCEVAVVVDTAQDLERLKSCWQVAFAAEWGEVTEKCESVRTASGAQQLRTLSVSTLNDPCVTIIAPEAGSRSLMAPVHVNGWHHVGFASADPAGDIAALERSGFTVEFRSDEAGNAASSFAMMVSPEGTRIKLVAR